MLHKRQIATILVALGGAAVFGCTSSSNTSEQTGSTNQALAGKGKNGSDAGAAKHGGAEVETADDDGGAAEAAEVETEDGGVETAEPPEVETEDAG